ncbi:MAG TPA: LysM peptidoglycan-binding domain-containing protein [Gemmatimonadota bacterium]|nr:LysM peptidoglycan-binding domain-containing protein [Gemmatimonadota bacterium]
MGIFDRFKDKEKKRPKADFSNVEAGGSSTAAPVEKKDTGGGETYTVQAGDSLWKISQKFYGDGNQWRRIYEANKATIKDPDLIHPGQTLTIPAKVDGK